jgi:hypothetical protein
VKREPLLRMRENRLFYLTLYLTYILTCHFTYIVTNYIRILFDICFWHSPYHRFWMILTSNKYPWKHQESRRKRNGKTMWKGSFVFCLNDRNKSPKNIRQNHIIRFDCMYVSMLWFNIQNPWFVGIPSKNPQNYETADFEFSREPPQIPMWKLCLVPKG